MEALSQYELIGGVVIALAAIFALFKYFNDYSSRQNDIYSEFNKNLVKCTMAIDNLNKYIEKMEKEVNETLADHEQRLKEHQKDIIQLKDWRENEDKLED